MKKLVKMVSVLLVAAMLITLFAGQIVAEEAGSVVSQTVAADDISVDVFRYTPEDFNFRGNNTPLIYVLGDKPYTEQSANTALNTLGFKALADKESCSILFVSPTNGESWTEADYAAMQTLAGNATDNYYYGNDYTAGVSEEGKFYSGRFRHYIFAEGSAVEFAKTYLDTEDAKYFVPEWYSWTDAFGAGYVYAENGFTAELVGSGWERVRKINRIFTNDHVTWLAPYYDWEENGVAVSVETMKTQYEDIPELEYYRYVPNDVDLQSKTEKYPMVLLFHGSGMHPDAVAQLSLWPLLAKQEKLIVLSVSGMYNTTHNAEVLAQLIDEMTERYAVDASRVYAVGFSKGSSEAMHVAAAYSEKIAGVGSYEFVYDSFPIYEPTLTMPVYSILGQAEFYTVFPRDTEKAVASLNALGKVNGFTYEYDKEIGGLWGYDFDLTESLRFEEGRVVLNEHSIRSEKDGTIYTKLVDGYNLTHDVHPFSSAEMWRFLSQFSRNPDGTLTVNEPAPFTDVAKDVWYYYPVLASTRANLFNGTGLTTFAPEETTSRAMLVTALYRMAGEPEVHAQNSFLDVEQGAWYEKAVIWASEEGVVNGVGENRFAPNEPVTREQTATMLCRYAEACGLEVNELTALRDFNDAGSVSAFAQDAVRWAVKAGLIRGSAVNGKLCLLPLDGATRAETATMLLRFATLTAPIGIE